jgi:HK97 family phage prohead protease
MTVDVRERRWAPTRFETRDVGSDGGDAATAGNFTGHAAVFGSRSEYLRDRWGYGWYEEVDPAFFDDALRSSDVRCLFNHDPSLILGRSAPGRTANTLALRTDTQGLVYDCEKGEQSYASDLALSMKRGDVTQSSFSFSVAEDKWGETKEGVPLRTLLRAGSLFDVSPVTFPAYPDADAGCRSGLSNLAEQRSLPIEEVVEACKRGELGKVIGSAGEGRSVIDLGQLRSAARARQDQAAAQLRALQV